MPPRQVSDDGTLIGILGGTFDPPHLGHLELARGCRKLLGLGRVLLIPAAAPPHRTPPKVDARKRCDMTRLAIPHQDAAWLSVDDRELQRPGASYTVDTLNELSSALPEHRLCLLLGNDAAASFSSWHHWREILGLAHVAVVRRAGDENSAREPDPCLMPYLCTRPQALWEQPCGRVFYTTEMPLPEISATHIRALLSRGAYATAEALLPQAVTHYIHTQGLYH